MTHVRYRVLAFACALAMLTYLDRACFAMAAGGFEKDLGLLSEGDLNWAHSAFALAYALFEIPTGWLGDVFGPRKVLIRIVLWWSAFTALTGLVGLAWGEYTIGHFALGGFRFLGITVPALIVPPMVVLVVVRFLFGMGEAGAFPNITRALDNWFPLSQRGFAQGAVWMAGRLMGGLTPLVWTLLVVGIARTAEPSADQTDTQYWLPPLVHWRAAFGLFGLLGVVWCIAFAMWFRNRPEEKPQVSAAELALIRHGAAETHSAHARVPWARILRSPSLWTLCAMYGLQSYGWYFYITYLPRFLEQQFEVDSKSFLGALYKGGPLWMGAIGCLLGGLLSDWIIRRTGNLRLGRRVLGVIGHSLTAVCFLLCPLAPSAFWFFAAISLAGFFTDLTMASAWAGCQDIGRRYAAIVAGCMNMIGNLGGALASWIIGFIIQQSLNAHAAALGTSDPAMLAPDEKKLGLLHGYHIVFFICAAVYVGGVICWLKFDATKPVADDEDESPSLSGGGLG